MFKTKLFKSSIKFKAEYNFEAKRKDFEKTRSLLSAKSFYSALLHKKDTAPIRAKKEHPAIDLLRHKSFVCAHQIADKELIEAKAAKHLSNVFKKM